MIIPSIKNLYHKYITDKNRNILRWIFLLGITIYLILSATPYNEIVERSPIRNIIFWSLNGIILLIVAVNMFLSIYAAIKSTNKKNVSNALCSVFIAILLLLFVLDIYNHNVFYTIQQYIVNIWK